MVLLSDDVIIGHNNDTLALINSFSAEPTYGAVLAAQQMDETELHNYGIVKFKDKQQMLLERIVEGAQPQEFPSKYVSYGRYLLTCKIFDYLDPKKLNSRGEFSIADGISQMAQHMSVKVICTKGTWATTGDPINYLKANILCALSNLESKDELEKYLKRIDLRDRQSIRKVFKHS